MCQRRYEVEVSYRIIDTKTGALVHENMDEALAKSVSQSLNAAYSAGAEQTRTDVNTACSEEAIEIIAKL